MWQVTRGGVREIEIKDLASEGSQAARMNTRYLVGSIHVRLRRLAEKWKREIVLRWPAHKESETERDLFDCNR